MCAGGRRAGAFTAGGDVGEALVLASFPLAVADVEVDVDRRGEPLVPVGRDLDQERVLHRRETRDVTSGGVTGC